MKPRGRISLYECLSAVEDPRRPSNGTRHDFREILVIMIAATLSDCDTVEEMADWARMQEGWLRRFLRLAHGIPSEDTLLRILRLLDPRKFEAAFRRWAGGIVRGLGRTLAVDGKTVRGSATGGETAIHLVSAYATDLGIVLGQEKVAERSNEITAIPELLDALYVKGLLVSIDAMGCQKEIAKQILALGGDYLLAVKGNQPGLRAGMEDAFVDGAATAPREEEVDTGHGRVVLRIARVLPAGNVADPADWPRCRTLARIDSVHIEDGQKTSCLEQRYYISSRELSAREVLDAVRGHWGIENQLHWVLDVNFGEDACLMRKDNAPQNLSLLRKIALNLLRTDTVPRGKKVSLRIQRKRAAWNSDIRMDILGIQPL